MKLDVLKLDASKAGSVDVSDLVFGITEIRADILSRVVNWQLAKRRAGTHKVQTRNENSRTGKKMYKQKGSGGARHGSRRAPQFVGGSRAFGPVVRDHGFDLQKKVRALGLRHALSSKVKDGSLIVLDQAVIDSPKTSTLKASFEKLGLNNALFITGAEVDTNFALASRNIPNIDVLPTAGLNVYDILRRQKLVLTKAAIEAIEARFADEKTTSAKASVGGEA
jgi:large subunit ribosomal protein L4